MHDTCGQAEECTKCTVHTFTEHITCTADSTDRSVNNCNWVFCTTNCSFSSVIVCVRVCHLHIVKNIKSTWTTIITCVEYVNEFRTGSNQPKKATNNVWEHMQKSHNKLLHCIAFYEFSLSYHTIIRAIVSALFTFSFIKITNIATNTIINANKVMPIECVACNALQVKLTFDPFIILLKWAQSH